MQEDKKSSIINTLVAVMIFLVFCSLVAWLLDLTEFIHVPRIFYFGHINSNIYMSAFIVILIITIIGNVFFTSKHYTEEHMGKAAQFSEYTFTEVDLLIDHTVATLCDLKYKDGVASSIVQHSNNYECRIEINRTGILMHVKSLKEEDETNSTVCHMAYIRKTRSFTDIKNAYMLKRYMKELIYLEGLSPEYK